MTSPAGDTQEAATAPIVTAPDGSEVRVLCAAGRGSMIRFALRSGAVSKAVAHRTVEEIWYVVAGQGRLWRKRGAGDAITKLAPGLSLTILPGTQFQFRNDGAAALEIVAVTMPPWPGNDEAYSIAGPWPPIV
jgi:mannose-6-phosphate isomerase-like protein (cupin superfamily)